MPLPRQPGLALALAQLRGAPGQAAVSLAAIVASFSLMAAMAIMVASFRQSLDDWLNAMMVDSFGNVYVTGSSGTADSSSDCTTIKYNSDGQQQWVARYNGPGNFFDYAEAIAIDSSGNVYVTGESFVGETYSDYTTIKYVQGVIPTPTPTPGSSPTPTSTPTPTATPTVTPTPTATPRVTPRPRSTPHRRPTPP